MSIRVRLRLAAVISAFAALAVRGAGSDARAGRTAAQPIRRSRAVLDYLLTAVGTGCARQQRRAARVAGLPGRMPAGRLRLAGAARHTGLLLVAVTVAGGLMTAGVTAPAAEAISVSPVAYITNYQSGTVTPIHTATGTVGPSITVGKQPDAVAITPDGS